MLLISFFFPAKKFSGKILFFFLDFFLQLVITSRCCNAIDQIVSFHLGKPGKSRDASAVAIIGSHISSCMDTFADVLKSLFKKVLWEECQNQWTVSRPMLSLILLNPQVIFST
jgi:exportin-7